MAKLNYSIVCENAIIDADSKNLYILGVFDKINADKFPALNPHKMVVVINASGEPGTHSLLVKIKNKNNNQEIADLSGELIISAQEGAKAQFRGVFYNVLFPERGFYYIEVSINNEIQSLKTEFFVGI